MQQSVEPYVVKHIEDYWRQDNHLKASEAILPMMHVLLSDLALQVGVVSRLQGTQSGLYDIVLDVSRSINGFCISSHRRLCRFNWKQSFLWRTHHSVLLVLNKKLASNADAAFLYSVPCSFRRVESKSDSRHLQACERQ